MIGVHEQTGRWHGLTSGGSTDELKATRHFQHFPNWLRFILALVACVGLTGCYDTRQEITLNPDGSDAW